jgi:hypothetical protein
MSVLRRLTAHISAVVMAALLGGTLFTSAAAFLAPTSVAAWPGGCDSRQKIAFIDFPGSYGLQDMKTPLRKLTAIWPVKALKFRFMTSPLDFSPTGIDNAVNEMESRVNYLEAHGFNRIGLPPYSVYLDPFINGTAGSLGGVDLATRHPNTVFVVMNAGTSAVDSPAASNLFRLADVPSSGASLEISVGNLVTTGGQMLIVYQNGDSISESIRDQFEGAATDLGIAYNLAPVDWDGTNLDAGDMASAAAAVDALPAGSLVVHAFDGLPDVQNSYFSQGVPLNLFESASSNGPIRHYAGNLQPPGASPAQFEYGYQTFDRPSWQSTRAGFPNNAADWNNDTRQKLYMDALGFLAKCGQFHGVLDGFLRFDAGGTRINKQLQRIYLPEGSTDFAFGEVIDNPRWTADQVTYDWKTVFGQ